MQVCIAGERTCAGTAVRFWARLFAVRQISLPRTACLASHVASSVLKLLTHIGLTDRINLGQGGACGAGGIMSMRGRCAMSSKCRSRTSSSPCGSSCNSLEVSLLRAG